MKNIDPFIAGALGYVLAIVLTFGHAHAYYTRTNECLNGSFCASEGEKAMFSAMFWPFYVSMQIWSDEP